MNNNDDLFFAWDSTPEPEFGDQDPLAKAPYAECSKCPLVAFPCVHSHLPPGSAPEDIELIAIGEAPGYHEVQNNEPFVGPSGQLLYAVFDHIGIAPNVVWKTNAVLCRPPNNDLKRYPGAIAACSKRLQAELSAIPARTMVALGASAVGALDALNGYHNNDGILKRRGQWYDYGDEDRSYLATLHPAFVLRSPGYISQFLTDMRSLTIDRSDADRWLNTQWFTPDGDRRAAFITELGIALEEKKIVAFDVETPNLKSTRLLALGLTWYSDEAWIIPGDLLERDPDLKEILIKFMGRARLVAHNGKFDQRVLAANGFGRFKLEADTMLLHYMIDEQKGTHGLKQLLSSYVGVPDYEAELIDTHFRSEKREARDYSTIPPDQLHQYLAIDCCGTLALHRLLDAIVKADDLKEAPAIAIAASNALQYTEDWGIKIDRPYLQTVLAALNKKIAQAKAEIQDAASALAIEYGTLLLQNNNRDAWRNPAPGWLKGTKKTPDPFDQFVGVVSKIIDGVNLGSWQQMQVLLYDILHLKHTKKLGFKTDPRSTNQEALDALPDHPFVRILQDFRRLDKIRGTYVEKLLELADENDRVHINFNIHGTETGRLSANDGLHGIPRPSDIWGRAIRGSFIADHGKTFVIADYSQAELRIFAAMSKEPFLLDAYNNDEDVHGNTTKILFPNDPVVDLVEYDKVQQAWYWDPAALEELAPLGIDHEAAKNIWKERRTTAKNVNFGGLVYLGGASGVAAMIRAQTGQDVSEKQLAPILNAMLANIPTARAWQMQQFRHARDHGFVQSAFGNKRRFMLITEETLDEVKKASVNAPIQNGASQLTLLSGIELIDRGFHVVHFNHDQLMIECSIELAERVAAITEETMQRIGAKYYPDVKWKADVEIATRWYAKPPKFVESEIKQ